MQEIQQRMWLDQQIREKEEAKRLANEDQKSYDNQLLWIREMGDSLEKEQNARHRNVCEATKDSIKAQVTPSQAPIVMIVSAGQ